MSELSEHIRKFLVWHEENEENEKVEEKLHKEKSSGVVVGEKSENSGGKHSKLHISR